MTLQPDHLITFARVAAEGSVSSAAEKLHRSQPAISLQLKHLSDAVGEPLYTRHRYGVTLTAAGTALLPYAQALVRSLAGAEAVVDGLKGLEQGTLRISASMTVAVYLLPSLLARFRGHYPKLELHLLTRNSREAVALLGANQADLCFIEGPADGVGSHLETHLFFEDTIVLVARPDHPLSKRTDLSLQDVQGLELVRREPGSGTREVVERLLAETGLKTRTVLQATGLEAVKEAALSGVGAAFLSKLALKRELEAGLLQVIPVAGVNVTRPMTLLHPERELCSLATRAFLDFVLG